MFDEFGVENCKIELVEQFPCSNKDELNKREGYHIRREKCVNKFVAGRTQHERWVENIEAERLKRREWNALNRDRRLEFNRRSMKCECGCEVRQCNMADTYTHLMLPPSLRVCLRIGRVWFVKQNKTSRIQNTTNNKIPKTDIQTISF